MTAVVFVHAEQTVNVGFAAASAGLAAVRADGWLKHASVSAYDAGLAREAGTSGAAGQVGEATGDAAERRESGASRRPF